MRLPDERHLMSLLILAIPFFAVGVGVGVSPFAELFTLVDVAFLAAGHVVLLAGWAWLLRAYKKDPRPARAWALVFTAAGYALPLVVGFAAALVF